MLTIFIILAASIAIPLLLGKWFSKWVPFIVAALLATTTLKLLSFLPVDNSNPEMIHLTWSKLLGIEFIFRLDGLAVIMTLLICFIGTGVFLYSALYRKAAHDNHRFFSVLSIFTVSMIGLVLSDHMIVFFLFWEATTLCSFLLVGTNHHNASTRESARKALFATIGGGLFLLLGFVMIALHGYSTGLSLHEGFLFSKIQSSIVSSPNYKLIVICLMIAIATKSAQFPFHVWLPAAMAGPTPVSSFLHSATMVKAGIFLLARLTPTLGNHAFWTYGFTILGAATMLTGAILATAQRDIKKILAYSTIGVLGILVMLLGIGSDVSIKAAVVFLVAHALYKAALFQIIGNIDFATGNRDLKSLGKLWKVMPITAIAAILSAMSMAGAPPLFGFFGKELAYFAKLELGAMGFVLIALAVFSNILFVGLALSISYRPFWSKRNEPKDVKPVPRVMALVPLVFAITGLLIGIFPGLFDQILGTQGASAIGGRTLPMKLALWHGINLEALTVLGLSLITLGAGIYVAIRIRPIIARTETIIGRLKQYGPSQLYDNLLVVIPIYGKKITDRIQTGNLSFYIQSTLYMACFFMAWPVIRSVGESGLGIELSPLSLFSAVFIALPAVLCLYYARPLARVSLMAASGFGIIVYFSILAAPDLALTQLLVESLVLIFILILFRSIPKGTDEEPKRFLISSGLFGILVMLLLAVNITELPNATANYFLESSLSQAFGKNVVNVILVDFRSLDTFGEVVVVAIAALGVGALLRLTKGGGSHAR